MKTINSFFANGNVKSVLAIAAVAISSVFGFTSCDKNDDAFVMPAENPQPVVYEAPAPKSAADTYLYIGVTENQLKYVDINYTLSVDGETKMVNLSDMTEVKDAQRLSEAKSFVKALIIAPENDEDIKMLEYHIGNAKEANIKLITYSALSPKSDHEIDLCCGAQIKSGMNIISEVKPKYYNGLEDIAGFMEVLNKYDSK